MKKSVILFSLSFFLFFEILAQPGVIDREQAGIVACKFYYERVQSQHQLSSEQIRVSQVFPISENGIDLFYFFNISTGGFVAVSATGTTQPVLCYSFSGKYDPNNVPDNFKAWIGQYGRQISNAINTKAKPVSEVSTEWNYYLTTPFSSLKPFSEREVLPMLTSTWNQGTFYNAMCPEDPAGPAGHCVTGCVATALGQLMNYFRWPDTGTGSYTYECPPYGTLSVDFSQAGYEWDLMENGLDHSNVEVAEVLYHLGVSVDMVYGPDGSGMYNHKAAYTLKTYFKYSPETQYVFRDSTSMDWDSLIVSHLDRNIPMYYAGWSVPNLYGHAFICDGYQGENYFHFNWGWGGQSDGYFYTDNLTPDGNNFNLAQELVINAFPDTSLYTYPAQCQGDKTYEALYGTLDDGSGPVYTYANGSDCSWLIVPNDSVNNISLDFHRFNTKPGDTLAVYDGENESAPLLAAFSGSSLPADVTSSSGSMFLRFITNSDSASGGFLASFESDVPLFCSGLMMLDNQADTLSDGSGTWNYHDNTACLWRIMPAGASSVTLFFTEFTTEAGYDILKIYDLQTQELLAEYSGTYEGGVPDPVVSTSGKLFLTWNTNSINTAPGWEAFYESNLVGVDESEFLSVIKIFPNPTDDYLTIFFRDNEKFSRSVKVTDLSGRVVFYLSNMPVEKQHLSIDIRDFAPGVYILEVNDSKRNEVYKIIKN